ncbi:metallopeptidase [Patescibacteria group bacterium]|nr:metallopeptidase [Patescibacteria group bacterium]
MRKFSKSVKKSSPHVGSPRLDEAGKQPVSRLVEWRRAEDVDRRLKKLINNLSLEWAKQGKIHSFRSKHSKTKAYARIWGLTRIWQKALGEKPTYIVEIISERFDKLDADKQDKILLHELAHIPKNFSGSLLPHIRKGKRKFDSKVDILVAQYNKIKKMNK